MQPQMKASLAKASFALELREILLFAARYNGAGCVGGATRDEL